jgi:Flp pilus assembly protein TadB
VRNHGFDPAIIAGMINPYESPQSDVLPRKKTTTKKSQQTKSLKRAYLLCVLFASVSCIMLSAAKLKPELVWPCAILGGYFLLHFVLALYHMLNLRRQKRETAE